MRTVFYEKVRGDIEDMLFGSSHKGHVILETVVKRNDTKLTGLKVMEEGKNLSPVVYLNDLYDSLKHGMMYEEILEQVVNIFREAERPVVPAEKFLDFEQIKPNIFIRVSDAKMNQEWLEGKVFHQEGDLACTYHCRVELPGYDGSMQITQNMLDKWGVAEEEVRAAAERNLREEKAVFARMDEVMASLITGSDPVNIYNFEDGYTIPEPEMLYILRTDRDRFGASILLREDIMERIGKMINDDFYLLPSSQHEVLLLPAKNAPSLASLQEMVGEINAAEVAPIDQLSSDVFYYDRESARVLKAKDYYAEKLGISKADMDEEVPRKQKHRDEIER